MQGGLWNQYTDPIEGENVIIYTQNKDKLDMDQIWKIIQRQYKMHNLHTS